MGKMAKPRGKNISEAFNRLSWHTTQYKTMDLHCKLSESSSGTESILDIKSTFSSVLFGHKIFGENFSEQGSSSGYLYTSSLHVH